MIDTTHYVTGAPVTWEALPTGASLATMAPALPSIASRWIPADDARRRSACIPTLT